MKRVFNSCFFLVAIVSACSSGDPVPAAEEDVVTQTPVTVSTITTGPLTDYVEFNATSAYLERSYIKAMVNGYITKTNVKQGQFVQRGQVLFQLTTREAKALGNSINQLDSSFRFSGVSVIRAANSGYVTETNHQLDDYVQEGEQLAVISNQNSFVFLLDLPYESNGLIASNRTVNLVLPDGEIMPGTIGAPLPSVDSIAQTQRFAIRIHSLKTIPEKLVAKVRLLTSSQASAQSIVRSAVLTNETEDEFWVMKLVNDTTAVKIPVKKGIENDKVIELLSPKFSPADRLIVSGNYGLADTAKIKIVK